MPDEIGKMYLKTSDKAKKMRPFPFASRALWLITLAALALVALVVVFKTNIDIKITILSETPAVRAPDDMPGGVFSKGMYFVKGNEPNTYIVRNESFLGDAKTFSRKTASELVFCNSRGHGWANYTLEFKDPIDIRRLDIRYSARGERGDEHLLIVLVDSKNRTYRMPKDLSSAVAKDWKEYMINFKGVGSAVDLSNIALIRFEFGGLTAGNYPAATIFVKDIYIARAKRLKWL
jgi:hypothetical protein